MREQNHLIYIYIYLEKQHPWHLGQEDNWQLHRQEFPNTFFYF